MDVNIGNKSFRITEDTAESDIHKMIKYMTRMEREALKQVEEEKKKAEKAKAETIEERQKRIARLTQEKNKLNQQLYDEQVKLGQRRDELERLRLAPHSEEFRKVVDDILVEAIEKGVIRKDDGGKYKAKPKVLINEMRNGMDKGNTQEFARFNKFISQASQAFNKYYDEQNKQANAMYKVNADAINQKLKEVADELLITPELPQQQVVQEALSEPPEEKQNIPPSSTSSASTSSVAPATLSASTSSVVPAISELETNEEEARKKKEDDELNEKMKSVLDIELENKPELENTAENYQKVIDKAKQGGIYKGTGYGKGRGLYESEIKQIMNKYESFLGVYANDELNKIVDKVQPKSRGSAIINTADRKTGGQHWQSIYFDARPNGSKSIEFYDSFGEEPNKHQLKAIKMIVDKLQADTYLKLKSNKLKKQSANSDNCGWFAMKFLIDRYRGKTFQEASGYEEQLKSAVGRGETEIKKFKSMYGGCDCSHFGYI